MRRVSKELLRSASERVGVALAIQKRQQCRVCGACVEGGGWCSESDPIPE